MKKFYLLSVITTISIATNATIRNVPSTYPTIQSAINACVSYDTVLVQPGTYYENITIFPTTTGLKLLSAGDSSNTIINGNNTGRVLEIIGADSTTIIRGFKITGGFINSGNFWGAGIWVTGDAKFQNMSICDNHISAANFSAYGAGVFAQNSPVFENSSIWGNEIDTTGYLSGAVACGAGICFGYYASSGYNHSRIINCRIMENHIQSNAQSFGAGLCSWSNSVELINVSICGNSTSANNVGHFGTGFYHADSHVTLTNVLIASNIMGAGTTMWHQGGGLYSAYWNQSSDATLVNVTITDNKRSDGSIIYGSAYYYESGTGANMKNCILWNPNAGLEIFHLLGNPLSNITYCDIRGGYSGTGNIDTLPGFVSATDFHLTFGSPCINSGTLTGAPLFDLENMSRPAPAGTNPDMGCYEIDQTLNINSFNDIKHNIKIFPNPATNFITLQLLAETKASEIKLLNLAGQLIKKASINKTTGKEITLDVSSSPSGLYTLSVITNEGVVNKKVVVVK